MSTIANFLDPFQPINDHEKSLDPQLWHACAGGMVQMPLVHSKVYFFPQGYMEHASNGTHLDLPIAAAQVPPLVLCSVQSIKYLVDSDSDEVYAKIQLVPIRSEESELGEEEDGFGSIDKEKPASFAKTLTLTQSDANNGGGFAVPRYCAETIFPRLDYSADPPVQTVLAKDVHGEIWKFRHIYRGTPRRHLLTTGWSTFVNHKKLVAGDSVVFLRVENGDLHVGIRRAKQGGIGAPNPLTSLLGYGNFCNTVTEKGRIRDESVVEAINLAVNGRSFEVIYYPRARTPGFVVRAGSVQSAMRVGWCPGMRFKMAFETEDASRISWFMGTINSVQVADPVRWPNSPWRLLQVTWDEPDLLQNVKRVSPWLVELVSTIPPIHMTPFSPASPMPPQKKLRIIPLEGQFLTFPVSSPSPSPSSSSLVTFEGSSMNSMRNWKPVSTVQGLYDMCKEVFAECGPGIVPRQEDVSRLSSYLEKMKPEELGLNPDMPYFRHTNSNSLPPPVTYLHIYQCPKFSIGIFCLPQLAVIPLHNHPGMTVFSKILFGSMHIKSYGWVLSSDQPAAVMNGAVRLAKVHVDADFDAPCANSILYPETGGNMHCFTANTACAVLDVLGPPYSTKEVRDCTYYDAFPFSAVSGGLSVPSEDGEYAWLRERSEIPSSFKLVVHEYEGLTITERQKDMKSCEQSGKEEVALEWDIQSVPPSSAISFIGRENEKESIIGLLMQRDFEEHNSYCVISIVGELGVGKTAIARAVYDDSRVLDTFDVRIFISMSRKFDDKQIMKAIIETITESSCEITESDILGTIIREEFAEKRFLIVLDEVTFENKGSLNFLRLLNISGNGSVILITTCSITIAEVIGSKVIYNLDYLLGPYCLEIIKSIAFVGKDPNTMDDFIWICKDLVTRSGRTPLCLKVLGGLLRNLDLEEWGEVLESNCWGKNKLGGHIFPALRVCYEYLPSPLKSCFSYFSLFPENYVFQKDEVICLWLSQGFIEPIKGKELEDIGHEYFDELLGRLFIEESHIDLEGGKFVMHGQIHDLAKHVSVYEYLRLEDHMQRIPEHIRHFSFVPSGFQTVPIKHMVREAENLQSFLVLSRCFWNPISTIANFIDLSDLIQKFRNLRTLSLSNICIEELPSSIGSLQNLSYLGLNNTRLKIIPLEISGLKNLQTLEAANCYLLDALPISIKELINLRHLDVTKGWGHVKMPVGIGNLSNLRSLPAFNVDFDPLQSSIGELKSLELLRGSLHISGLENEMSVIDAKEANLAGKFFLEKLSLQWSPLIDYKTEENGEDFVGMVLENLKPCYNLHELIIKNYMGSKFPTWMGDVSYSKLESVILDNCPNCDMFPAFGSLPVLKYLSVRELYGVKELRALGKFPSLQLLNLWDMYELETIEVKVGDFPCLQTLSINRCHKLRSIPCIPSLLHLYLHFCFEVPDIPELPLLEFLKVEGFKKTEVLHLPTNLPVLKNVEILDCGELRSLEDISKLTSVEKFKIIKCPKLDLNIN